MSSRTSHPAKRPVPVALCLIALTFVLALVAAATADAAEYKMVACAADNGAPVYRTATNTTSPQNPGGIFNFANFCYGQGGDPPGEAGFMRISENQDSGNAGWGAYGDVIFDAPPFVHFRSAGGYTRQPNAFNDGWRSQLISYTNGYTGVILTQGAGLPNSGSQWAPTATFASHLWPFGTYWDFKSLIFEVQCVRPAGCDRTNFNATDLNGLVFILADEQPAQIGFTGYNPPLLAGQWVRGSQGVVWSVSDQGSGVKFMRVRVDGTERHAVDTPCSLGYSQTNGQWARSYSPCPTGGPWALGYDLDTASLADGAHNLSVCGQDFAQYQGLNGTGSESCDQRTIRTDNTAPGAPLGLQVTSANPNRYLDRFGAQFALPPNQGSPIAKVHYDVVDAVGNVVVPEKMASGTNPSTLSGIEGPAKAGDYRLRAWLEDEVGLSGPAATAPIPHDTMPPAAPQGVAVTAPATPRAADGFDLRWHNIVDNGSPVDSARYQVLDGSGKVVVPTTTAGADNIQAVSSLDVPSAAGSYQLRLWLTDAEGNVGAPVSAPLAYECMRSPTPGATQLSVSLAGQPVQTVQQGQGASLTGVLSGSGGPVTTAPVCIYSRVATDPGLDFLGIALTDRAGGYRFPIPGGPSREISAVHRPDQRQLRAAANLRTVVHPTLRTPSSVVRNGTVAHFEGEIPGPHNDQVTIVLQVKSGNGWLAFRRYRTRNDGHYDLEYTFRRTRKPTTYEMRAQVRETTGYPYEQGDSDPLVLRVVPGRDKPRATGEPARKRGCSKQIRTGRTRASKRCHPKRTTHKVRKSTGH
jgi:hypothetical protein